MKPDKAKLHHLLEELNLSEFFELCEKQGISSFELNRLKKQFILRGSNLLVLGFKQ
jgi:hypothetical protein